MEKAIPNFIVSALQNQPLTIHGNGKSSRDWMFVEDTCEALNRVLHAEHDRVIGQTINLGTGTDTSVVEIARRVLSLMNKPESLIQFIDDRPGQVTRHISSVNKSREYLDWQTKVGLDEGLKRTIEFYQNNRKWWERIMWMKELWAPKG